MGLLGPSVYILTLTYYPIFLRISSGYFMDRLYFILQAYLNGYMSLFVCYIP